MAAGPHVWDMSGPAPGPCKRCVQWRWAIQACPAITTATPLPLPSNASAPPPPPGATATRPDTTVTTARFFLAQPPAPPPPPPQPQPGPHTRHSPPHTTAPGASAQQHIGAPTVRDARNAVDTLR